MSVRRTLAAALAAGLLLTGCTDEPEPEFTPTETPSPSVTESETAEPEAQSPEEFVQEWVSTYNAFEHDGDSAKLAALTGRCPTCNDLVTLVTDAYSQGGFVDSEGWEIQSAEEIYQRPGAAGVRAQVMVSPSRFKPSRNGQITRGRGGEVVMEFDLVRTGDAWKLTTITRSAS